MINAEATLSTPSRTALLLTKVPAISDSRTLQREKERKKSMALHAHKIGIIQRVTSTESTQKHAHERLSAVKHELLQPREERRSQRC